MCHKVGKLVKVLFCLFLFSNIFKYHSLLFLHYQHQSALHPRMSFQGLPADIISRIEGILTDKKKYRYASWKSAMVLLWVCSSWRQVSMPWLYGLGIIECKEDAEQSEGSHGMDYLGGGDDDDDLVGLRWLSNLSFIKLQNNGCLLNTLIISLETSIQPLLFIQQAIRFLHSENVVFRNVHSFEINIRADTPDLNEEDEEDVEEEEEEEDEEVDDYGEIGESSVKQISKNDCHVYDAVNALASSISHILTLRIHAYRASVRCPHFKKFCVELIGNYADQLKTVVCQHELQLDHLNFSSKLKWLQINISPEMPYIPQVDVSSLMHLSLENVPARVPWSQFENKHTPGHILFGNLHSLTFRVNRMPYSLETAPPVNAKEIFANKPKIQFPVLNSLHMELCSHEYLAFIRDWKPIAAKDILLSGTLDHVSYGPFSQLQAVGYLSIFVECAAQGEQNKFYKLTNHLFGDILIHTRSNLVLCKLPFLVDIHQVSWPNLTDLTLSTPIELSHLLELLTRLQRLQHIVTDKLTFNELAPECGDYRLPEWSNHIPTPLSTTVKCYDFLDKFPDKSTEYAASIMLYVMVQIPSLSKMVVHGRFNDALQAACQFHRATYPQLDNISRAGTIDIGFGSDIGYPGW